MGVQTARFNLEEPLIKFAEKHNIPIVTTLLSKSSISESHPLFQGVYFGEQTRRQEVKELVHNSDCLLIFGEMLTDISLGFVSPKFDNNNTIFCSVEHVRVKNHIYCGIRFVDFCKEFFKSDVGKKNQISSNKSEVSIFSPIDGEKIILKRFFEKLNTVLNDNLMVIADIGEGLFDTADLTVSHHRFISSAFYCSMGLAIPGSLGAQLSRPEVRPLVIVGEGSFKSSSCEISTLIDNKLNPIIFILTTKQGLLKSWNYHKIFDMISGGLGCVVETERDLEEAISSSLKKNCISIVNVILDCPSLR
jgi:indolepyruvate decarboxylase